jgi:hypothetical protein
MVALELLTVVSLPGPCVCYALPIFPTASGRGSMPDYPEFSRTRSGLLSAAERSSWLPRHLKVLYSPVHLSLETEGRTSSSASDPSRILVMRSTDSFSYAAVLPRGRTSVPEAEPLPAPSVA